MIFRKSFFIAILILLSTCCRPNEQNNDPFATSGRTFKTEAWSYYTTDNKERVIGNIIDKYAAAAFKPFNHRVLNEGIPDKYYWIHFNIENPTTEINSLVIDIDNARLNELELFEVSNNTAISLGKLGDFQKFYKRNFLHKNFLYQVSILPGKKKEYFLFINQVGHAFVLPMKVVDFKSFNSATFGDYLFDGVTYGVLLFVAILSFLFFATANRALYFYYGLYIITTIIWFLSYFGLGFQYIWSNHPALNTSMSPCMAAMNLLLNLQICQILMRLSKTNRVLYWMVICAKVALFCVAVFPLLFNLNNYGYSTNVTYLMIFLCLILFVMLGTLCLVFYYASKGLIEAKFYLFASILKATSIVNLALLELGIAPAFYNMETTLQIGIFIEIALFTYALATRYTNYRIKTFEKVIEAHESERSLISHEIHDGVSSSLTAINYGIKNFTRDINHLPADKIAQLNNIFDQLNRVQLEARNISHNTMPDYIKNSSITEIVTKHIEEMQNKIDNDAGNDNHVVINFSANKQVRNFSEAVKLNIFRIIQEIIVNVLKHADAKNADIVFSFSKREMIIIAEDDGIGFINSGKEFSNGVGLKNLKSRVKLLEGTLVTASPIHKRESDKSDDVQSAVTGFGTMIKIRIPYKNKLFKSADYDY